MKMSEGQVVAWRAVALALQVEEPAEIDLLPDIIDQHGAELESIGRQPGAFDANQIVLVACSLYEVASSVLAQVLPKLFDAALDVGKDVLKKRLNARLTPDEGGHPLALPGAMHVPINEIRQAMTRAAELQKLSPRTAQLLADSVIAALAEIQKTST
jgi:hypothetical protein